MAQAFTQERITDSHAKHFAYLLKDVRAKAFERCSRKEWQDEEAHLLHTKHLAASEEILSLAL